VCWGRAADGGSFVSLAMADGCCVDALAVVLQRRVQTRSGGRHCEVVEAKCSCQQAVGHDTEKRRCEIAGRSGRRSVVAAVWSLFRGAADAETEKDESGRPSVACNTAAGRKTKAE